MLQSVPPTLARRCSLVGQPDAGRHGDQGSLVLCWLRRSVRASENPALDAAAWVAADLGLPLAVVVELSASDPGANIRAWRFALQGTVDLHNDLVGRGWPTPVVHVQRPTDPGSAIRALASQSRVVVTDASQTLAMQRGVESLAKSRMAWILEVESSTPQLDAHGTPTPPEWEVPSETPRALEELLEASAADTLLGCSPLLHDPDAIERALHEADIHLGLAPMRWLGGGRIAGESAWRAWAEHTGKGTPDPRGYCGLRTLLSFGHLSPWWLARQAHQAALDANPAGTEIVRFIAADRPGAIRAMREPSHPGPIVAGSAVGPSSGAKGQASPGFEELVRGRSGDHAWDSIQRRLLSEGWIDPEHLPFWAARVRQWAGQTDRAMATLIELLRCASPDADDPWMLAEVARAIESDAKPALVPATPVRPAREPKIAVVGAGLAGLTAARAFSDLGLRVDVFDRGRSAGGRATTKRLQTPSGGAMIDQGCQYLTPIDPRFARMVESWRDQGVLSPWRSTLMVREELTASLSAVGVGATRYVGTHGMQDLARHLLQTAGESQRVHLSTTLSKVAREADRWNLSSEQGDAYQGYDALVIAAPPEQAARLFAQPFPGVVLAATKVRMGACWAGLLALREPLDVAFDAIYAHGTPVLYACRETTKPGRTPPEGIAETWIVHMTEDWSEAHIDHPAEDALPLIVSAFANAIDQQRLDVVSATAHRWKFARCKAPLDQPCLFDSAIGLGLCGDWCLGTRAESAYLSAMAVVGRVLEWLDY